MFESLDRTMAVRRELLDHFDERAIRPGEPMSWLNPRFAHVYLHHRYSVEGLVKYLGGMEYSYSLRGDGQERVLPVPPEDQRRALDELTRVLSPEELEVPEEVLRMIPPAPPGYQEREAWFDPEIGAAAFPVSVAVHGEWIGSPAFPAIDPFAMARSFSQEVIDHLFAPERVARIASFHSRDPENLSLFQVFGELVDATWGSTGDRGGATGEYARAAERAVLDGLFTLASEPEATAAVRDAAEDELHRLGEMLEASEGVDDRDRAHRSRAHREIQRFLNQGVIPDLRTGVVDMPLPWP